MAIATTDKIIETLDSIDVKELLDKMEDYVRNRFYDKSEQNKNGLQFQDFCQEVLRKACDGTRKWKMEKSSFEDFIFGTLRSDLSYFFKKGKIPPDAEIVVESDNDQEETYIIDVQYHAEEQQSTVDTNFEKIDDGVIINNWIESLKSQGADQQEINIFECWTAGIKTPKEVAEYCNLSVKEVNNIYKRLRRKKIKIDTQWTSLKKQ